MERVDRRTLLRLLEALASQGIAVSNPIPGVAGGTLDLDRIAGQNLFLGRDGSASTYNINEGTYNARLHAPLGAVDLDSRSWPAAYGALVRKHFIDRDLSPMPLHTRSKRTGDADFQSPAGVSRQTEEARAPVDTSMQVAAPAETRARARAENLVPGSKFTVPLAQVLHPGEEAKPANLVKGYEHLDNNVFGTNFGRILRDDGSSVHQFALYRSTTKQGWNRSPSAMLPWRYPKPAQGKRGTSDKKAGSERIDFLVALLFKPPPPTHANLSRHLLGGLLHHVNGVMADNRAENLDWHPVGWKPTTTVDLDKAKNLTWAVPSREVSNDKKRRHSDETLLKSVKMWSEGCSTQQITEACGFSSDGYTRSVLGQYGHTKGRIHRSHEWLEPYRCKAVLELITADRIPNGFQILLEIATRHGIDVPDAYVAKTEAGDEEASDGD